MDPRCIAILLLLPLHLIGQAPVAVNDTVFTYQNITVTIQAKGNDYDPDGGPLFIDSVLYSGNGTVINFSGLYIQYTSFGNFKGTEILTYIVCDDDLPLLCDTGLVVVNVLDSNKIVSDTLDINNVSAIVNSNGALFYNSYTWSQHFEVPKGSGKHTIFLSKMWMGATDQFGQKYGAYGFYGTTPDFAPGPIMDGISYGMAQDTIWNKVWKLSKVQIENHITNWNQPGYKPIKNIKNWPAQGSTSLGQANYLAPFFDANSNGSYDPSDGDYPIIKGDQSIYFIYNDDKYVHGSGGRKMNVEVHGELYSFDCPTDSALHNSVFLNYRVINRSPRTYYNFYLGQMSDIDIGQAIDDITECDVSRSTYFIFNYDSASSQGVAILRGPRLDENNLDDPSGVCNESVNGTGFGDGVVDNEHYGLTGFITFCNTGVSGCNGPIQGGPVNSDQCYQLLQGAWKDGTTMRYGGNGHLNNCSSCEYARFMFPSGSDTCHWGVCSDSSYDNCGINPGDPIPWNMETSGVLATDIRGVGSYGPFTLESNDEVKIDIAFVYGNDYDSTDNKNRSIEIMKMRVDSIRSYFFNNQNPCGGILLAEEHVLQKARTESMGLYPNPTAKTIYVKVESEFISRSYAIYDLAGRKVKAGLVGSSGEIHVHSLPAGVFVIRIQDSRGILRAKFVKL